MDRLFLSSQMRVTSSLLSIDDESELVTAVKLENRVDFVDNERLLLLPIEKKEKWPSLYSRLT